jgi:hypothetical protein
MVMQIFLLKKQKTHTLLPNNRITKYILYHLSLDFTVNSRLKWYLIKYIFCHD